MRGAESGVFVCGESGLRSTDGSSLVTGREAENLGPGASGRVFCSDRFYFPSKVELRALVRAKMERCLRSKRREDVKRVV